jgi:hypothetical protein
MTRRGVRLALFLVFVAAIAAVTWFGLQTIRRADRDREAAQAFERSARRVFWTLSDLRTGLQAYVAAGQGDEFWRPRVAEALTQLKNELPPLRDRAREASAIDDLDAAVAAVDAAASLNDRAGRLVRSGATADASRLIFGEGLATLADAATRVDGALQAERAATERRLGQALEQAGRIAAGTAVLAVLLMGALLPVGRQVSQRAGAVARPASEPALDIPLTAPSPLPSPAADEDRATTKPAGPPVASPSADAPAADGSPARDRRKAVELKATADLCTDFARLLDPQELPALLDRAARLIDASGFIVWVGDPDAGELRPALAHGYTAAALSRLPAIPRDADNATAAAWRGADMQIVQTNGMSRGALVTPLFTPAGCVGVLAAEIRHGRESSEPVRAMARIIAAQIAMLVSAPVQNPASVEPAAHQVHA